jgi:hypothetical protein
MEIQNYIHLLFIIVYKFINLERLRENVQIKIFK